MDRTPWLLALLLAIPALAGCTAEPTYAVGGAFTSERTEADMQDFDASASQYSDDIAILESFPEQFRVGSLSQADCEALREELLQKDYLGRVGDCTEETEAGGDQPTSSPYART